MSAKQGKKEKAVKKAPAKTSNGAADTSKLKYDTRAIPVEEWDWSRLMYSEPNKSATPDGTGNYRRVRIQYRYDDEHYGPAIVSFGKHYCFGVQANNVTFDGKVAKGDNGKDKPLTGYRVPIVMTSVGKNNPTAEEWEEREVQFLKDFREEVARYAFENKKAIGKGSTKTRDGMDALVSEILYFKKTDDVPDEDVAPKFYTNLKYFAKTRKMETVFYGPGDKEVNPLKMTDHFYIYPNIQFDSIYISAKISLQHRIYDATVEPRNRAPKARLARPNTMEETEADNDGGHGSGDDDDAEAEIEEEDDANDMMESE